MSNKNVFHARVQRDFRRALESEPEGTLLVLNERGAYAIPADMTVIMGSGNSVKAPWADVVEEVKFDWRQAP